MALQNIHLSGLCVTIIILEIAAIFACRSVVTMYQTYIMHRLTWSSTGSIAFLAARKHLPKWFRTLDGLATILMFACLFLKHLTLIMLAVMLINSLKHYIITKSYRQVHTQQYETIDRRIWAAWILAKILSIAILTLGIITVSFE